MADIFRAHGPTWRQAEAGHLSLGQLKVMSAIEHCRTAAFGGHVARCEKCANTQIAYNSCRNRHCPKCQGAAAKQWLAERQAELLLVPYFHVVFTLPAAIADIAYQNKAVVYHILFKAGAETLITIAADPEASRRPYRVHRRAAHLGLGACTHHPHVHYHRAGRRHLSRRRALDLLPAALLPTRARALAAGSAALFLKKLRSRPPRPAACASSATWRTSPTARRLRPLTSVPYAISTADWVVYAKRPFAGPRSGARLSQSRYTHRVAISNSRLIALDDKEVTFKYKDYRAKGADLHKTMALPIS